MDEVRALVFSMPVNERNDILSRYQSNAPPPLNTKFTDKPTRAEAIENYSQRKQKKRALNPSGE